MKLKKSPLCFQRGKKEKHDDRNNSVLFIVGDLSVLAPCQHYRVLTNFS